MLCSFEVVVVVAVTVVEDDCYCFQLYWVVSMIMIGSGCVVVWLCVFVVWFVLWHVVYGIVYVYFLSKMSKELVENRNNVY